ncbi:MAG TPA: FAD-dependent oxidoreductase [Tepidisphaeraceae bacterium]|nr:FAD-dependent oxidoreductase [Tepidisphaeraceae bacterium]
MAKKNLAIIGNGMAASRLLDDLLARGANHRYAITVFGDEPGGCYNRVLLSKVLAGADPDEILIKPADWYERHGVRLVSDGLVTRLDTAVRRVHTACGGDHPYDVAVLATGSAPFVPPISGLRRPDGKHRDGLFIYRTLDDCLQIRSKAKPGDTAVVLGGGLLGLEAAKALADRGAHVTVVHLADWLMNLQLDRLAGDMLRRQIERAGIFVRCGVSTTAVLGERDGGGDAVRGVQLGDGTVLPADMLVLACGVRPRVDVAAASGIPANKGVIVNDLLATRVPGVYAVGECAEHAGTVYGIVQPIYEQTAVLADVLSGAKPCARYRGSKLYTRLKVAGVDVAAMGVTEPGLETDEVVQVIEDRKPAYRKLIVRDGRLIGAQMVGETSAAAALSQWFDRADPLPAHRLDALCRPGAGGSAASAGDRLVCNCNRVTEAQLQAAVRDGACTVEDLGCKTKAGTGCGSCKSALSRLLERTMPKQPVTAAG